MDISVMIDDVKFNYRVGAIIRNEDKILLHKNKNDDYYAIPGGRVKIGEDSETAIKREFREEQGENIIVKKCVGTIENFFVCNQKNYHEILMIYEAEFEKNSSKYAQDRFKCVEKDDLEFIWKSIEDIKNLDIRPNLLKEYLISGQDITHRINRS